MPVAVWTTLHKIRLCLSPNSKELMRLGNDFFRDCHFGTREHLWFWGRHISEKVVFKSRSTMGGQLLLKWLHPCTVLDFLHITFQDLYVCQHRCGRRSRNPIRLLFEQIYTFPSKKIYDVKIIFFIKNVQKRLLNIPRSFSIRIGGQTAFYRTQVRHYDQKPAKSCNMSFM